ncbi:hypothetical protein LGT39_07230 [Demequina sp. TTPB684]|uniref:hypothetical protein n=1 Tax=unclassified Demequina TaxID=2620311 RepID=UPI001CF0F741|nr:MULTISPECIES: hypothetical protein [unclassified Demequina]MCB2412636.1 hypothetical protein [Demequina sp. TTPB684]UPU87921.1 hypothetical protein LGT36_011780 [Demequina sp. TMPB413]
MMYAWIWRHLPGPVWLRAIEAALALALVVLVLFEWVFPFVSAILPFQEQTVDG